MHLIRWLVSVYPPFCFYLFAACETEQEIPLGLQNEELKLIKGNGTREVKLTIKHKSKQHRNQHDIETSTTKTRYKGTWGYQ